MNWLTREEVFTTYNEKEFMEVRDALTGEDIMFECRTVSRSGAGRSNPSRIGAKIGSYGLNMNYDRQYYIYVNKKDLEYAKYIKDRTLTEARGASYGL